MIDKKVVMIRDEAGSTDEQGSNTRVYKTDEVLPLDYPWERDLAEVFISIGAAVEYKDEVLETKAVDEVKKTVRKGGRPRTVGKPKKKPAGLLTRIQKKIR